MRYTDPDGQFDIKPDFQKDALFYFRSTMQMKCVPLGGGYSDDQQNISRATSSVQALINVGISFGNSDILGDLATGVSLFSDPNIGSILKTITELIASDAVPALGKALSIKDLAVALFSTPELSATKYWGSEQEIGNDQALLTRIGLEQSFAKDLCNKFKENGILYNAETEGEFIMNITVWQDSMDYNQIYDIANEVKNSNPIYSSVLIFQE